MKADRRRLRPRRTAGRDQHSPDRHAVLPRRRPASATSAAISPIITTIRPPATATTSRRWAADKIAGNFSLKWAPDDSFNILLRADISAEHDTGSTYHDLGYFVGQRCLSRQAVDLQHSGTCTGFTDLLGHVIAPYYTNYLTGTGASTPDPAAYNALLNSVAREQNYGFWSTEQTVSNADDRPLPDRLGRR